MTFCISNELYQTLCLIDIPFYLQTVKTSETVRFKFLLNAVENNPYFPNISIITQSYEIHARIPTLQPSAESESQTRYKLLWIATPVAIHRSLLCARLLLSIPNVSLSVSYEIGFQQPVRSQFDRSPIQAGNAGRLLASLCKSTLKLQTLKATCVPQMMTMAKGCQYM